MWTPQGGVYIPWELAEDLVRVVRESGVGSMSKVMREGLRLYIAEHRWRVGVTSLEPLCPVYDREAGHADEELTDMQHRYLDVTAFSLHVHLDRKSCPLIIAVRGPSESTKSLVDEIERIDGVKVVRLALMPARPERARQT